MFNRILRVVYITVRSTNADDITNDREYININDFSNCIDYTTQRCDAAR